MADVFGPAYTYVEGQLDVFLNDRLSDVVSHVQGPLQVMLVLYVVLYGYTLFKGVTGEPVMDGVMRMIKLAFVYVVATTVAYQDWVTDPLFHDLPNALAHAVSGDGATGVGQAFDQFVGRGFGLAARCANTANLAYPMPWVAAVAVYIATALAATIGFCITMIALVSLALLVAVGPIFIACLVFQSTRQFFFGWLSQAVNYLVLFALILAIFRLVLALVESQWDDIMSQSELQIAAWLFSIHCIIASIFFFSVPRLAAGIANGAHAGVGEFMRAGGWAATALSRAGVPTPSFNTGNRAGGTVSRASTSPPRRHAA